MDGSKKFAVCLAATALTTGFGIYFWRNRRKRLTKEAVDDLMNVFDRSHVYIRNPAIVREKLKELIENGKEKLQVLSDFDMTISKFTVNGKPGETSHGAIEKATCMPDDFREKATETKQKYSPLENNVNLSYSERAKLMVEWWETIHELILEAGFQKRWIPGVVSEANIALRDGADEFFHVLKEFNLPLYIVSAGIGDIIEELIQKDSTLYNNTRIIANFMDFDDEGYISGFKGELIHSYNKQEIVDHARACFDSSLGRSNMILLGDTLGDPNISDDMKHLSTVLKIGFLNSDVDGLLEAYKQVYDIVIVEDETLDIINVFIKQLMKTK